MILSVMRSPRYSYRILGASPPEKLDELLGEFFSPILKQVDQPAASYPADPGADIPWTGGKSNITEIEAAFNQARRQENTQLGTALPDMNFPSQAEWDAMTDGEHLLWLVNRERVDRGALPMHGLEENINSVAQTYADYLLENDKWGHYEDGRTPWERIDDNPTIHSCKDTLFISEGLAAYMTSGGPEDIGYSLERSFYLWMYKDGDCCDWGHRHTVLWNVYNNNSGPESAEGFLGVGRAKGGPYQGYAYAEITVMDVFDPCSNWDYSDGFFSLAGSIKDCNGNALSGVAVHIVDTTGAIKANLSTDASGNFSTDGLAEGEYTIVPSFEGYLFLPLSREATISGADITGVDFQGTQEESYDGSLVYLPEISSSVLVR